MPSGVRLLFVSAPIYGFAPTFVGAPTSLLWALSSLAAKKSDLEIDEIYIYDPVTFSPTTTTELVDFLEKKRPVLVGIGNSSAAHYIALKMAAIVRSTLGPDVPILFGGAHENVCAYETVEAHSDLVDVSFAGDAEYGLLELVRIILEYGGKWRNELLKKVELIKKAPGQGQLCLARPGRKPVVISYSQPLILDQIPFIPRYLLEQSYNFGVFGGKPTAQVLTVRGCPFHCSFCSSHGQVRARSVENVLTEVAALCQDGIEAIFFDDATFTFDAQRTQSLCRGLLTRGLDIEWGCQTRVDKIDAQLVHTMRAAGCSYIYFGIESFDQSVLDSIHKGFRVCDVKVALEIVCQAGIRPGISLVFGLPAETPSSIKRTLSFVESWKEQLWGVSLNLATCFPGTALSRQQYNGDLDFDKPPPYEGYPWCVYEEGLWYHPSHITGEFAATVLEEARQRFGELLLMPAYDPRRGYDTDSNSPEH